MALLTPFYLQSGVWGGGKIWHKLFKTASNSLRKPWSSTPLWFTHLKSPRGKWGLTYSSRICVTSAIVLVRLISSLPGRNIITSLLLYTNTARIHTLLQWQKILRPEIFANLFTIEIFYISWRELIFANQSKMDTTIPYI